METLVVPDHKKGAVKAGIPIPDAYDYISCGGNGEVKFQVRIYARTDGTLLDNSFHFALIGT